MGVFGVFLLRKKVPSEKKAYKVPLYPVTPVIGIVFTQTTERPGVDPGRPIFLFDSSFSSYFVSPDIQKL